MVSYEQLKSQQPESNEVFFAFSQQQFDEGKAKMPTDAKILRCGNGMYATQKGIDEFRNFASKVKHEIINNCTPQEVYNYEFNNHECAYEYDDSEAITIVANYFPNRLSEVKRMCAIVGIDEILATVK